MPPTPDRHNPTEAQLNELHQAAEELADELQHTEEQIEECEASIDEYLAEPGIGQSVSIKVRHPSATRGLRVPLFTVSYDLNLTPSQKRPAMRRAAIRT